MRIDNAGWDVAAMERCREGLEKFSRTLHDQPAVTPLRPRAIFHLRRQWDKLGGASLPAVARTRRGGSIPAAGLSLAIARRIDRRARRDGAVGDRGYPFFAAFHRRRPLRFDRLDGTVDEIVATLRASR